MDEIQTKLFYEPKPYCPDSKLAQLCLALVPGIGPQTLSSIQESSYSCNDIYNLSNQDLKRLGLSSKIITYLKSHPPSKPSREVDEILTWSIKPYQHLLFKTDADFPKQLREIGSPPNFLLIKGRTDLLKYPQVAVVGSRNPTPAGEDQAYGFSKALADAGYVVTSGLAQGIDSYAHRGTLDAHGHTIAVLGTGIDVVYPRQNIRLAEEIAEKGALISEFPLNTQAKAGHFPRRNRIVSGLSLGTLVVEATVKSGSLVTARQALEQNREIFAIPGSIYNPQKAGCHYLIQQGAVLVDGIETIISILSKQMGAYRPVSTNNTETGKKKPSVEFTENEAKLFRALDFEGCSLDVLLSRSGLSVDEISSLLMEWELAGKISQDQGIYVLI